MADVSLRHVKPHGALYNMSARDQLIAQVIAKAVKNFNSQLILVGLSGSCSIEQAIEIGLDTISEVYADRTYQDDGTLTPRVTEGAMITDPAKAAAQVLEMVQEGTVTTVSGSKIPIIAESICLHGDGPHVLEFAKTIQQTLKAKGIDIRPS